ncbi:cathepsin B-like [Anoplophora glabripennis]|uniref:cathepsin B-like n=1 Tax=Anoplophora glabripennis TaxID=217634 RepID=UPI0008747120|nr:cathepsin B-like [Anoplophora glabripennis]XP_023310500.1 cathepsin B-like [Anoplophora glabripennis]
MKIILCLALVVASHALPKADVYPPHLTPFRVSTPMDQLQTFIRPVQTLPTKVHDVSLEDTIPESFDAREQWPDCPSIGEISDTGNCWAPWALSAVSVMSDRFCIHSKGEKKIKVSAEDLLGCCQDCSLGCLGGYPDTAWDHWVKNGIVTGGGYGDTDGCKAYAYESCNHYVEGSEKATCEVLEDQPTCVKQCDSSSFNYENELTFGKNGSAYALSLEDAQIQLEIMTNGPVQAEIVLYRDFYDYKSGVYQPAADTFPIVLHFVKVIGWGVENGTPYWLGANSFNTEWGDKGFFKISREVKSIRLLAIFGGLPEL